MFYKIKLSTANMAANDQIGCQLKNVSLSWIQIQWGIQWALHKHNLVYCTTDY